MKTLERILEWGGIKKDITLLIISLIALLASLFEIRPFIFDLVRSANCSGSDHRTGDNIRHQG